MRVTRFTGGLVVGLDPPSVEARDLVVVDDRVVAEAPPGARATELDCRGCLLLPGLVVAHTHLYSALARGMPGPAEPPTTFRQILERLWWRLDAALDAETLAISAEVAAIEAARAGVTCLVDHHESPSFIDGSLDVLATAIERVGLRAALAYGATDRHGAASAAAGLAECRRFARAAAGRPTLRAMVGLHAPFTCSDETLGAAGELARELHLFLHAHAAEGPDDQRAAHERWGSRLVPGLVRRGLVGPRSIFAHAVDLDDGEVRELGAAGAWITHQARSNMNNGVGYAARLFGAARVAIGTDGIDDDLLAEVKAAFFRGREHSGPSVWRDPVAMIARGHELASALFGERLGQLGPGAPADVVVLDYRAPSPVHAGNLGGHLIFGLGARHVRDVFVAGKPVVRDRRVFGVDEERVYRTARQLAPRLWAKMEG